MPPSQPLIDTNDMADPGADVGQRVAAATQAAQSALTTWAIYGQRGDTRQQAHGRGDRVGDQCGDGDDRGSRADERRDAAAVYAQDRVLVAEPPARVRPLIAQDAGLDAVGAGSSLTAPEQAQVRRRFAVVPDPAEVQARIAELDAAAAVGADEAAEAGALYATNDDNPATVSYIGGTNRRAGRSARVRDAMGDANEQVGEEARDVGDPLAGEAQLGDWAAERDPLELEDWESLSVDPLSEDHDLGRRH